MALLQQIRRFLGKPSEFKPGDMQFNSLNAGIGALYDDVRTVPFLDGVQLTQITLSLTPAKFTHGMGRAFRGALAIRVEGGAVGVAVSIDETTAVDATVQIPLVSSSACVANVWVF